MISIYLRTKGSNLAFPFSCWMIPLVNSEAFRFLLKTSNSPKAFGNTGHRKGEFNLKMFTLNIVRTWKQLSKELAFK